MKPWFAILLLSVLLSISLRSVAQESPVPVPLPSPGGETVEGTLAPSVWVPDRKCWCVAPERLARAVYLVKTLEATKTLQEETAKTREDMFRETCDLKVDETQEWCRDLVESVQVAHGEEINLLRAQGRESLLTVSEACSEKIEVITGVVKPKEVHFWEFPWFWGVGGFLVGSGLTVSVVMAVQ